ncbi:MAG: MerR family transcriptional regulator [Bacteroidales bacterium]|nr:MerR family transcriptional regulator [Bacteroidales bacterium]MBQ4287100.1 MerR family transcriptional regulator [Bacteroidales bacterium]MBQ9887869.1 MerR family transcriptional regulator [Bacteroidales bacterium]
MEKLYYTIGEVAEMLGENVSLVRFWSNYFTFLKPTRNAKGNRLYTKEDLETFRQIHMLIKDQGMTLDGAAKRFRADRRPVEAKVKVLDSLKSIRAQLDEVRKSL